MKLTSAEIKLRRARLYSALDHYLKTISELRLIIYFRKQESIKTEVIIQNQEIKASLTIENIQNFQSLNIDEILTHMTKEKFYIIVHLLLGGHE
jgi:hypothetical protein